MLELIDAFVRAPVADAVGACSSRALAAARDAHRMLLQQALLLRGRLPATGSASVGNPYGSSRHKSASIYSSTAGASAALSHDGGASSSLPGCRDAATAACDFVARQSSIGRCGSSSPGCVGAAMELLLFLRSHVVRLQATLDSLPGATAALQQQQQMQNRLASETGCCAARESGSDACERWSRPVSAAAVDMAHLSGFIAASCGSRWPYSRPVSAQPLQGSRAFAMPAAAMHLAITERARPASAHRPQQQHFALADLRPYLEYPPKRPGSGKSREVASLQAVVQQLQGLVQQLQQQVQVQQEQIQQHAAEALQCQEYTLDLQQQLEQNQQELVRARETAITEGQQVQGMLARQREHSTAVEQQLAVAQEQLTATEQGLQASRQHAAEQVATCQQQLQDAVQQVQHQQGLVQQSEQQVQQLQQLQSEQQVMCEQQQQQIAAQQQQLLQQASALLSWEQHSIMQQQQLAQAVAVSEAAAEAAAKQVQEPIEQAADGGTSSGLAKLISGYAAALSVMSDEELQGDALSWQELCAAIAELLGLLKQLLASDGSTEVRHVDVLDGLVNYAVL